MQGSSQLSPESVLLALARDVVQPFCHIIGMLDLSQQYSLMQLMDFYSRVMPFAFRVGREH